MLGFFLFLIIMILQRISELILAKHNERWMKKQGGREFGENHYRIIVMIHSLFFIIYFIEVVILNKKISPIWPYLLAVFLLTQAGRVWALVSLGKYWNTKIIVVPGANVVVKGPYKYLKHPNYVIVMIEFLIIPLLFQAYFTAIIFSLLNLWVLSIRIPEEEKALNTLTTYQDSLGQLHRFVPKI
ncbi:isoprenylcysteine carboxyl methyltransferase family protein [Pseudoneobacillus sp. C159]